MTMPNSFKMLIILLSIIKQAVLLDECSIRVSMTENLMLQL